MKKYFNVYMDKRGYGKTNFELKTIVNVLENRINKAIEYIEKETKELYSKNRCCKYLGEIMQLEYVLNILRGEDK